MSQDDDTYGMIPGNLQRKTAPTTSVGLSADAAEYETASPSSDGNYGMVPGNLKRKIDSEVIPSDSGVSAATEAIGCADPAYGMVPGGLVRKIDAQSQSNGASGELQVGDMAARKSTAWVVEPISDGEDAPTFNTELTKFESVEEIEEVQSTVESEANVDVTNSSAAASSPEPVKEAPAAPVTDAAKATPIEQPSVYNMIPKTLKRKNRKSANISGTGEKKRYEEMSPRELLEMATSRGIAANGMDKEDLILALKENDRNQIAAPTTMSASMAVKPSPTAAASATPAKASNYKGMKPRALLDIAATRNIDAGGKGKLELIELLEKWDLEHASESTADDSAVTKEETPIVLKPAVQVEKVNYKAMKPRVLLDFAAKRNIDAGGKSKFELIELLEKWDEENEHVRISQAKLLMREADPFSDFTWAASYNPNSGQYDPVQMPITSAPISAVAKKKEEPMIKRTLSNSVPEASTAEKTSSTKYNTSSGFLDDMKSSARHNSSYPEHEGWLYKKGAKRRNWLKRWFELKHNSTAAIPGGYLCYYESDTKKKEVKGRIAVSEIRQVKGNTEPPSGDVTGTLRRAKAKEMHHLQVTTVDRVYYFAAESNELMEKWVEKLQEWLDRPDRVSFRA